MLCTQSDKEPEHTRTPASDAVPNVGSKRQGSLFGKDNSDEPLLKRGTGGSNRVSIPTPMAETAHDGATLLESASHVQATGGKNVHAIFAAVPAPPPADVAEGPPAAKEGGQKPVQAVSFLALVTRRPDPIARNTASAMAQPVVRLTDIFVGHCGIRIRVRCVYFVSVVLVFCRVFLKRC